MKKITMFLFSLVAIFALASCDLDSSTTIEFKDLPETVYEAKEYSDEEVEAFLSAITVVVDDQEVNLTNALLKVSGFSTETLKAAGNYTLVVEYNSASISFSYSVVAPAAPLQVSTADELIKAGVNGGVYEIINEIDLGSQQVNIQKSITIYGNGNKIKTTGSRVFNIQEVSNIKTNMYNLDLVSTGERCISLYQTNNVELRIENSNIESNAYTLNLASGNNGTNVTVVNSTIKGGAAINVWSNNSTIVVENSNLISTWDPSNLDSFGVIVINGGNRDFDNIGLLPGSTGQNNVINVNNSTLSYEYEDAFVYALVIQDASANNTVNFNSTTVEFNEERIYNPDKFVPVANRFYIDGVRQ